MNHSIILWSRIDVASAQPEGRWWCAGWFPVWRSTPWWTLQFWVNMALTGLGSLCVEVIKLVEQMWLSECPAQISSAKAIHLTSRIRFLTIGGSLGTPTAAPQGRIDWFLSRHKEECGCPDITVALMLWDPDLWGCEKAVLRSSQNKAG